MRTRVLVTCFEPFEGRASNASMRVLAPLFDDPPDGVTTRVLPVDFRALRRLIPRMLRQLEPRSWILLGEDSNGSQLRCERIAVNLLYGDTADNTGARPHGGRAIRGAPDAYFTTLDPVRLHTFLTDRDIPAALSNSAGTYACNLALYLALHHIRRSRGKTQVGFIHVPRHYRRTGRTLREIREAIVGLTEDLGRAA